MNYLSFMAGMGAGAFIGVAGMIFILRAAINGKNKAQDDVSETNKMSLEALQERNRISELQLQALQKIALK